VASVVVQTGVAGALKNLAGEEANRKKIVDAGGVAALEAAAKQHITNEKLQSALTAAKNAVMGLSGAEAAASRPESTEGRKNSKRGDASERKNSRKASPRAQRPALNTKGTKGNSGEPPASQRTKEATGTQRTTFGGLSRRRAR